MKFTQHLYRIYATIHNFENMYHIKEDKRQQATAEKIREGMRQCLSVKNMSEITVSDISDAAGVSRSTFYRSFDMPIDVLSYSCDRIVDMIIHDYGKVHVSDADEFILFSLKYWRMHADILEALVHCDRMDIVHKAFESRSDDMLGELFAALRRDFTQAETDYLAMGIIGLMSNMLVVWMKHGKKETPEQLFVLYKKFLSIFLQITR